MADLPLDFQRILKNSFAIRSTVKRKNGQPRVVETTYHWPGGDTIVLSGHPGKRDWVASMNHTPEVMVHTVQFKPWFDMPATARVVRDLDEKVPLLVGFITNWSNNSWLMWLQFKFAFTALRVNQTLGLPWWGPFGFAKRMFSGMPCVVLTLHGEALQRDEGGPPRMSEAGNSPFGP
jgi:hypothetical protein